MDRFFTDYGLIIKAEPIGEYDRRLVILTKDHGKISAFARGARRQNSKLMASSDYFVFGTFKFYASGNSYSFQDPEITNYFDNLRNDFDTMMYGMYFLEVADFLCRENNDEEDMLILLYQSLRALLHEDFDNDFVKMIFELKAMMLSGEFMFPDEKMYLPATIYTLNYIYGTKPQRIYSFSVTDEVHRQLKNICLEKKKQLWKHTFNSEALLNTVENL